MISISDCSVIGNVSLLGRENYKFKSYQSDKLYIFLYFSFAIIVLCDISALRAVIRLS